MSDKVVDPMHTAGRWLVTTASGARHLVESTPGPLWTVSVSRMSSSTVTDTTKATAARLRRAGSALRVASIRHAHGTRASDGIRVGQDMILVLEPLDPEAMLTVRRTTPVVSIEALPAESADGN